jgi:hypothetical protein
MEILSHINKRVRHMPGILLLPHQQKGAAHASDILLLDLWKVYTESVSGSKLVCLVH